MGANKSKNKSCRATQPDLVKEWLEKAKWDFEEKWDEHKSVSQLNLEDFHLEKTLGSGSFGRVMVVKHKVTDEYYAMKILDKAKIVRLKQIEHTMNEKKILYSVDFPFIVKLKYHFQDNCNLYMVMNFVNGGDMFGRLQKFGKFPEDHARYYAVEVCMVFEYLHHLDILYRDLKPENLLIDSQGHCVLTDLGFTKHVRGRAYTLCGTPEYLAPEIILAKGYGKSVDWWAFGVLMYEMAAGYPPFQGEEPLQIFEKIVAREIHYPTHFSDELKDLLDNVIQTDLSKRYGNLKDGVEDIRNHPWFQGVDWIAMFQRHVPPPYFPHVTHPGDASNFDSQPEDPIPTLDVDEFEKDFADF